MAIQVENLLQVGKKIHPVDMVIFFGTLTFFVNITRPHKMRIGHKRLVRDDYFIRDYLRW